MSARFGGFAKGDVRSAQSSTAASVASSTPVIGPMRRLICTIGLLVAACQPSLGSVTWLGDNGAATGSTTTVDSTQGASLSATTSSSSSASTQGTSSAVDSATDAEMSSTTTTTDGWVCDLSPGAWAVSEPLLIQAINTQWIEWDPFLFSDGRMLYFSSERPKGEAAFDTYVTTRASLEDPFGPPVYVTDPGWNQQMTVEGGITLRDDGLEVFLARGDDVFQLWTSTRASMDASFVTWQVLPGLTGVHDPHLSSDGLNLYLAREIGSDFDLAVMSRDGIEIPWGEPEPLLNVNTGSIEISPSVSDDERVLFFTRQVGSQRDIFVAHRSQRDTPFDPPEPLTEVNTDDQESEPFLAMFEGTCELYFSAHRGGDWAIYRAAIVQR